MRILAVANRYPPWSLGGYEALAAGTVAALRAKGHTVSVLTTLPDPSDLSAAPASPDVHRELRWYWREHRFPRVGWRATVMIERHNARVLRDHLRTLHPDAVIWWGMGGMSLSLLEQVRRAGIPAVAAVGDDWLVYGPQVDAWTRLWRGRYRRLARVVERVSIVPARLELELAARWTFNSQHTLEAARRAGWSLQAAIVVHPGVDAALFRYQEPGEWRWRLLYCGRLDPRKGVATAIETVTELPNAATLTILGDGARTDRDALTALASRLGVSARVAFARAQHTEVPAAYAAADAVVFPVLWEEPWGLVPLEAMATGRPVIASRAGGGVGEYLRDGENCLQFPTGDAGALAAALRRLADDQELRERLIAGGRETAARFTARCFHDELERELELAVAGGVPKP